MLEHRESTVAASRKRVLVIGLDGGTFDLIEPWAAEGYLPNLSYLMSNGCRGRLASTLQPLSAPAWTTFLTGANQGRHGLYDFVRRQTGSYKFEVTNASMIALPTIFDLVGRFDYRVVSLNVPCTFPPHAVHGVLVSGPFAPVADASIVYPPSLGDKLMSLVDGYFIVPDYDPGDPDPLLAYWNALMRGVAYRRRLATQLMDTEPWDLFVVVFGTVDQVQHSFWHFMAMPEDAPEARFRHAIRDLYRSVDDAICSLLERIDEDTVVIVMSDHGFGPLHRVVNLNRWLAEAGFLRFRPSQSRPRGRWRAQLINKLTTAYRHAPAALRRGLRARLGAQRFERLKGDVETALFASAVEWTATRAYALGAGGKIYLNVAGREPEGIVQPGPEYETLRNELADALAAMEDPETGQRIVLRVWRREELYRGPFLDEAPDLAIEWADYRYWGRGRYDIWAAPIFERRRTMDFSTLPLTGTHRPDGIFIASGPGVKAGTTIDGARIVDLAPTILRVLDLAIPEYMDGTVLQEAFVEGAIGSTATTTTASLVSPPKGETAYTAEETAEISQRLEDLGYL
jgi:predicted AlkP superfamily phosphohydrolase/phosphomutase